MEGCTVQMVNVAKISAAIQRLSFLSPLKNLKMDVLMPFFPPLKTLYVYKGKILYKYST